MGKMADFTPILTLIITIVPIILLISILATFLKGRFFKVVGGKKSRKALKLATISAVGALAFMVMAFPVLGAAAISPSTGTLMTDIPNYFSCTGLTASTAYSVNVTVGGSETVAIASATSGADGDLSFSLTFTTEGSTQVEVITGGAAAVTGNYNVINFINMIMPYIVLAITLSVLFGVVGLLSGLVRFRK